jgi:hypothetical protein
VRDDVLRQVLAIERDSSAFEVVPFGRLKPQLAGFLDRDFLNVRALPEMYKDGFYVPIFGKQIKSDDELWRSKRSQ